MTLTRAKQTLQLGQYAYPLSYLVILVVAYEWPFAGSVAAVLSSIGLWLILRSSSCSLKQACDEQTDLKNQLVQSQKISALGEISTGIAHEINNPLSIIMQEAELMRTNLHSDSTQKEMDELRESLDVVFQQVERCSDITHKLLDFARKRHPVTQCADINRLLLDMLNLLQSETEAKNIRIVKRFSADIPKIKTDPPLLRQVFLNLLNNAVQAVDKSGEILVTTWNSDDMAFAQIRDTGPGISEKEIKQIFNPFYTTKPPGKGTGLGLSVSLRIVNQLGGYITVDSELGKGAAFTVHVPI
ncbi:sensor histidine kinase [Maridesulfovibrio ferrireducens]|uniref:sensor histidine kinase n=1 Tax=Maridesulfovibrio ferrireducens TaxID=246191 RepID=UPI001A2C4A93|nr:ATP-binding protein [Maridesulfovibrio ferrireducens]MBI9109937.1 GHKL domain-containing protein [Maridesulfovibrio ferrireducens]